LGEQERNLKKEEYRRSKRGRVKKQEYRMSERGG
jgi:hypothetical protein